MKKQIEENIKLLTLESIIDRSDLDNVTWFWINRDIFRDIIYNIKSINFEQMETQLQLFLNEIRDEEFIDLIRGEIISRNYIEVKQNLFSYLDKEFKPFNDINTIIFVSTKYLNKLWIKAYIEYDWILKAMAVDSSKKERIEILDVYKENFESNNRIVEEMIDKGEYIINKYMWVLDRESMVLKSYFDGKFFLQWTKGEAENKFKELF